MEAPRIASSDGPAHTEIIDFPMRGDRNQNPEGMGLVALVREDLRTHGSFFAQGFWALAVNRFGNWRMSLPRPLRLPFTLVHDLMYRMIHWTCRIELPYIVRVGRRVPIASGMPGTLVSSVMRHAPLPTFACGPTGQEIAFP